MLAILFICLIVFGAISLPIGIAMGLATMLCLKSDRSHVVL